MEETPEAYCDSIENDEISVDSPYTQVFETPATASTSLDGAKAKLDPIIKLERIENLECYKKALETYLKTKRSSHTHQKPEEEPNFQLIEDQDDPLSADSYETKYSDVYKNDIKNEVIIEYKNGVKEEDIIIDDIEEKYSGLMKGLDIKCGNTIDPKIEFVVVDDDNQFESINEDQHDVENSGNGDVENSGNGKNGDPIAGEKHEEKLQGKLNEHNFCSNTSSKYFTVLKLSKAYKCKECNLQFSRLTKIIIHLREVHKIFKIFDCNDCYHSFSSPNNLKKHIDDIHKKVNTYKCNTCSKTFSSVGAVTVHVNEVHKGVKRFQCGDCDKMFYRMYGLKVHIDNMHREINYLNGKGTLKLGNSNKLKYPLFCSQCDKIFFEKRRLEIHISSIHMKITDYKCNICQKEFFGKDNLRKHFVRTHNRSKCYKCDSCHEVIMNKSELKIHLATVHDRIMNTHDFQCPYCNKTFLRKDNLKAHISGIHEKNHQCSKCLKYFFDKRSLKRHVDSVHEGNK